MLMSPRVGSTQAFWLIASGELPAPRTPALRSPIYLLYLVFHGEEGGSHAWSPSWRGEALAAQS